MRCRCVQSVAALRFDAFVKLLKRWLFDGVCFVSFRKFSDRILFYFVSAGGLRLLFCSGDTEHARHAADAAVDD